MGKSHCQRRKVVRPQSIALMLASNFAVLWRKRHRGRKVTARAALCALIVLGTAILTEGVLARVPFPASGGYVPGSYRAVIFNTNLCDHSTAAAQDISGDGCRAAPNHTFGIRAVTLINEALNYPPLLPARDKWRGQQFMDWRLIVYGRDRLPNSNSKLNRSDESREFSAVS
jgi:hypothetical protein